VPTLVPAMRTMTRTRAGVRDAIGATLDGDVLEIGPGHQPFPAPGAARVTFADRTVEGGRDATWPELVGQPHGPRADAEVDLDTDGLRSFGDGSFDAVVASHMIEHVANPLAALSEMHRVLRPGGRLVLVVPDRDHTFDAGRAATPLRHLVDEYRRGVTQVDDDHIREFCAAIYAGPVIHPPDVRGWHDPDQLDADMLALHRRRTIHVHCWDPQEFAALVVGAVALDLSSWRLVDVYLRDDLDEPGDEFGLVLERIGDDAPGSPADRATDLARAWVASVLADPRRDPGRIITFQRALQRDIAPGAMSDGAAAAAEAPVDALVDEVARLRDAVDASERGTAAVEASRSYRVGRAVLAPARLARRVVGDRAGRLRQS
jgi:SAM-dependent methyltransferase